MISFKPYKNLLLLKTGYSQINRWLETVEEIKQALDRQAINLNLNNTCEFVRSYS